MQVVDGEQRRLIQRDVGGEPVEAVEKRKGALCRSVLRAWGLGSSEQRLCDLGRA
jgi:hypothetical protein